MKITGKGLFCAFLLFLFFLSGCGMNDGDPIIANQDLSTISLSPSVVSLRVGETHQFSAIGSLANGTQVNLNPTWVITENVGTIDSDGVFTATNKGLSLVKCIQAGVEGVANVVVNESTGQSALGVPQSLGVSQKTVNSAIIVWDQINDAEFYKVSYGTDAGAGNIGVILAGATYKELTGLNPETVYYVKVASVSNGITSLYSSIISFTTDAIAQGVPATPNGPIVTQKDDSSATLTWNAVVDADGYSLSYGTDYNASNSGVIDFSGPTGLLSGLNPETKYYVKVLAYNENGDSAWSLTIDFTTDSVAPPPLQAPATPTGLTVTNITHSLADIEWQTSTGATGYHLRYSTNPDASGGTQVTTSSLTKRIENLNYQTVYYVKARAYNAAGNSAWSPVVRFVTKDFPDLVPGDPIVLTRATAYAEIAVDITANPPPHVIDGRLRLKVRYGIDPEDLLWKDYIIVIDKPFVFPRLDGRRFVIVLDNLRPDTTYYMQVAYDDFERTYNYSDVTNFNTLPNTNIIR